MIRLPWRNFKTWPIILCLLFYIIFDKWRLRLDLRTRVNFNKENVKSSDRQELTGFPEYDEVRMISESDRPGDEALPSSLWLPSVYSDDRLIVRRFPALQSIPKVLHFMWKSDRLPQLGASNVEAWRLLHPDWRLVLWTDEWLAWLRRELLADSDLGQLFDSLPEQIMRVDVARYAILLAIGGVYADIDVLPLHPLDNLLRHHSCVLAREPEPFSIAAHLASPVLASNFLMASRPGHPFWRFLLKRLPLRTGGVVNRVGPVALTEILQEYSATYPRLPRETAVFVAPSIYFSPPTVREGDALHLEILRRSGCPKLVKQTRSTPYARLVCAVLALERRIDWTAMYRQARHFNGSFTFHLMGRSYDEEEGFPCDSCEPGLLSKDGSTPVRLESPTQLVTVWERKNPFADGRE